MSKIPSLSKFLKKKQGSSAEDHEERIKKLQLKMLKIQQGLWHNQARVILAFEGFDAAGKGGAIKTLIETLDPRGFAVHPIAAPDPKELAKHYLFRFWAKLPSPGVICLFDRSWYGRVLVEKVEKLIPEKRVEQAYEEICAFERTLTQDGIFLLKFFIAINPDEQLRRYEDRIKNPYKQWKIGKDDLRARKNWDKYVEAADRLLKETHKKNAPWFVIPGDDKMVAREMILKIVTDHLESFSSWMESSAVKADKSQLKKELAKLKNI